MSAASMKGRWAVWAACAALAACGRLGFEEHALTQSMREADAAMDASTASDAGSLAAAAADAAALGCTPVTSENYCTELPHLDHFPLIDGKPECGLELRPFTPQGWIGVIPSISSDQGTPRVGIAWHEQGIYVYLEVVDGSRLPPTASQEIWCGDAAEAYVDSDGKFASATMYDNPGTIQLIASAPSLVPGELARGARYRDGDTTIKLKWSTPYHMTFLTETGYGLEAFITAPDLDLSSWTLHAGDMVGVDVSANVSLTEAAVKAGQTGDCGYRAGQWFFHAIQGCTTKACTPYRNTSAFCTPTLR